MPLVGGWRCALYFNRIDRPSPRPRARTLKPGPRHLRAGQARSRPQPVRSPHGHTFGGGSPVHTSRYRSCDLSLSSHSPTANQGGAECHHCGHPQQNPCPMHEVSASPWFDAQRNQISQRHEFAGARTHKQTGTNSMQYANASWGDRFCFAYVNSKALGHRPCPSSNACW